MAKLCVINKHRNRIVIIYAPENVGVGSDAATK